MTLLKNKCPPVSMDPARFGQILSFKISNQSINQKLDIWYYDKRLPPKSASNLPSKSVQRPDQIPEVGAQKQSCCRVLEWFQGRPKQPQKINEGRAFYGLESPFVSVCAAPCKSS